jgi:hypothetical protein
VQNFVFDSVALLALVASVAACRLWIQCYQLREEVRNLNRALRKAEEWRKESSDRAFRAGRRGGKR